MIRINNSVSPVFGPYNMPMEHAGYSLRPPQTRSAREFTGFAADWSSLNPQTLPPKNASVNYATFPLNWLTLNSQPLPPKQVFAEVKAAQDSGVAFGVTGADPAANRGIIIVGGHNAVTSQFRNGIIIVGGRSAIR